MVKKQMSILKLCKLVDGHNLYEIFDQNTVNEIICPKRKNASAIGGNPVGTIPMS